MIRKPARQNNNQERTAVGASIPGPTGGWNAQDPLPKMPAKDAVILDNWIPQTGEVVLRKGYRPWVIDSVAPIQSLVVWRGGGLDQDQAFAPDAVGEGVTVYLDFTMDIYAIGVSPSGLYNVTDEGSAFVDPVWAVSTPRIEYVNFANDAGAFVICVTGADTPFVYDGTTWAVLTITGSSGPITLDPETLSDVMAHKQRLFFIEGGSLRVWFLDVNAIQGAALLLDLGPLFTDGGILVSQGTWSVDSGQGQDDYAVFMTSEGQFAVYQGSDPADADNWALVGVFHVGAPLGKRSLFKFGGDLIVLTRDSVLPLSQALRLDRAEWNKVAITAKIQNAFLAATAAYRNNFGWDAITYHTRGLAIYNIPIDELVTSHQYVQNLQTGAWCRFTGLPAFCWQTFNDGVFFGGPEGVYRWDVGVTDNGEDLVADMKTAFNYFGRPGILKQFTMLRPILNATANVTPAVEMLTDFREQEPVAVPTTIVDRSDDLEIRADWTSVTGLGYCAAARMQVRIQVDPGIVSDLAIGDGDLVGVGDGDTIAVDSGEPVDAELQTISFDLMYQPGGLL